MMRDARARVLKTKTIYTGRVFGVRQDRVIEPGGVPVVRDIVTHRGSVVLLPVFPDGRILLVRQYRHAVGGFLWELVAGRMERGESPLASAKRELLEETGYSARRFRKLLDFFPTPGYITERMLLYAAEGLTAGAAQPEADERIVARKFTLRQLEGMIRRGSLRDGKSIAGVLYYARFCR
jgi:ADP-ribose pyrophosphatase